MPEQLTATEPVLMSMEDALFGAGLPAQATWHLNQAAAFYHRDREAEEHLRQAAEIAPDHPAVLVGLYRFYFYKCRLDLALAVSLTCLARISDELGLKRDWTVVQSQDAKFGDYGARLPRFYLFTLKAYAYLQLRLGQPVEGRKAVMKLLELDPTDKVGARVLLEVLQRQDRIDDD